MNAKIKDLNIQIHKIEEVDYQAPCESDINISPKDLATWVTLRIKRSNTTILSLLVEMMYAINTNDKPLSKLEMRFDFKIKQLPDIVEVGDDNTIGFKIDVMPDLFRIATDTMRGIYYEKTKDTVLKKYILPLLDTQEMLNSMKRSHINKDKKEKE